MTDGGNFMFKLKWCLTSTETLRLIRDGESRGRGYGGGDEVEVRVLGYRLTY